MAIFKNIILRDQYTGYGGGGGSSAPSEAQQSTVPSSTPTSPSSNTSYSGEIKITQESKDILPVAPLGPSHINLLYTDEALSG